jgi:hypothetical protein
MAYDPTCTETKAAVKAAVAAALAEAEEAHELDVAGLKKKNKELIADLKEARKGNGGDVDHAEVERLETELTATKKALRTAEKAATDAASERDEFKATAEKEATVSRDLLVNNGLTAELTKAKVKPELLPAVTALLKGKVEIKEVSGERKALVEGKPLGEFITAWSQGDEGKHYIAAPENGGGGASHKKDSHTPPGGTKLSELSLAERTELAKSDPQKLAALVAADKQARKDASRRG